MNAGVHFHILFTVLAVEHLFVYTNSCLLPSFVPPLHSLSEPSQTDTRMLIVLEAQFYVLGD